MVEGIIRGSLVINTKIKNAQFGYHTICTFKAKYTANLDPEEDHVKRHHV